MRRRVDIVQRQATTSEVIASYEASHDIFLALLAEVRTLSNKKPDATMSAGKVSVVNRVLQDLLAFLEGQPEGKYLAVLDDKVLPQVSDALLMMVQFESALEAFWKRHTHSDGIGGRRWTVEE